MGIFPPFGWNHRPVWFFLYNLDYPQTFSRASKSSMEYHLRSKKDQKATILILK